MDDLIEKLAELEHKQWAHWTLHMLGNLTEANIIRWQKQIAAPYATLTEREKDKDREWGRKVFAIVLDHFAEAGK